MKQNILEILGAGLLSFNGGIRFFNGFLSSFQGTKTLPEQDPGGNATRCLDVL